MRPTVLLALGLTCALACPALAHAMIAVSLFRPPLRAAAAEAGRCPEIREGRHAVRLRIEGDGRGHEVELTLAPEGTAPATRACIAAAFEAQRYPAAGTRERRVGSIVVNYPFVVAPPSEPEGRTP